jgi:hypothetical protein
MTSLDEAFETSTSVKDAFKTTTWESEYNAICQRETKEKEQVMAEQLMATFGILFSDLRPKAPSGIMTRDGTTHYIHTLTGDSYGYVYRFGNPRWIKKTTKRIFTSS